jgi:CRP-like cAMP-binding protein
MDTVFQPLFDFFQLFRNIPDAEKEIICAHITFRKVEEGTVLLDAGKRAKELFFISKGILKIVGINEKGNPVTMFFVKENHLCTILNSLLNDVAAAESILTACDAELIVFSKSALEQLYNTLPYFRELIGNITRQALLNKIQVRNAYLGEDATTRYQKFLLMQPDIALRVTLSDIASYLGITQQSLSRIRKHIR